MKSQTIRDGAFSLPNQWKVIEIETQFRKIKLMKKSIVKLLIIFPISFSCFAKDLICGGKVEQLSYHGSNKFMVKLSGMNRPVFFCNPDEEWVVPGAGLKTGPETCKMMYSTFLAAKTSGKEIKNVYFDGNEKPESCDSFGPWSSVSIRHFIFE